MARRTTPPRKEPSATGAGKSTGKAGPKPSGGARSGGSGRKNGFSWRRALAWALVVLIWTGVAGGVVVAWYAYTLPPIDSLTRAQRRPSVRLLSADGQTIATYGDDYAHAVTLAELPPYLPQALLATEDRRFYQHFGIDLVGMARALVTDLRAGHIVQGGSTITQQLAKTLFLSPERSLRRKVQEVLLALWLEHKFTKNQILTMYLNQVYLGSGCYGVEAAARRYFGVPAARLTLPEAAVLAGLPKAPSRYNPLADPGRARQRATQVLENMVDAGVLKPSQLKTAEAGLKQALGRPQWQGGRYFADYVMDRVDGFVGRPTSDLVVRTTLEVKLQAAAERDLGAVIAQDGAKAGVSEAALVTLSPHGAIRALVGGADYAQSQFNRATQALRQPGSSFKPFLYLAALESGVRPDDVMVDKPVDYGGWSPHNFEGRYEGAMTVTKALADSVNTIAAQLIAKVGPQKVIAVARRLGIASPLHADYSLALGTNDVSLLELTGAYGAFANGGYAVVPYAIEDIRDARGHVLYRHHALTPVEVVAPPYEGEMVEMMTHVISEGTGRAARLDRPAAGKTGTSSDFRDAWFMGFTADYVTGVWMGNDDGTPMRHVTGGSLPAQLWRQVMTTAEAGRPVRPLPGGAASPTETLEGLWQGLVSRLGFGPTPRP